MPAKRKLRVFLSYSSKDKPIVRDLYNKLASKIWIDPWLDEEKLMPGQNWDMEIESAIEESDVIIICCSKKAVVKEGYLQRELAYALNLALEKPEETLFIIPLRLDNCDLPRRLKSWQYADYFPAEQKIRAFERLLFSLRSRAQKIGINVVDTQALDPSVVSTHTSSNLKSSYTVPQYAQRAYLINDLREVIYLPSKQTITIGRLDEENSFSPDIDLGKWDQGNTVSRKHCEIVFYEGRYFLQSLKSLNGTFVNGKKIGDGQHEIKDGDEVGFAGVIFRFRYKPHVFT